MIYLYEYTKNMEDKLDDIAKGNEHGILCVKNAYK